MWWIDLVLILIVIMCLAIGVYRGFFRSVISLFGFAGSATVAYLLKDHVANLFNLWFGLTNKLSMTITNWLGNFYAPFVQDGASSVEGMADIVNASPLNGILKTLMNNIIASHGVGEEMKVADIVAPYLANIVAVIVAILVVFILVRAILALFGFLFEKISRNSAVGVVNRSLGFVFGGVKAVLVVGVLLTILALLCMIPAIGEPINKAIQSTYITKHIFNFISDTLSTYLF